MTRHDDISRDSGAHDDAHGGGHDGAGRGWRTLVQAETLAEALRRHAARGDAASDDDARLVVFDCRFSLADTAAGEAAWREARLPGAHYAHLDRDLSGAHAPGAGRHPWPAAQAFAAWLQRNGVGPRSQVVAYDAGDGAFAARLWWLLRCLGHADAAVLDGGWARWNALGLPVETGAPHIAATASDVTAHAGADADSAADPRDPLAGRAFDTRSLLDADAVRARLDAGDALIDARAAERFRGEVEPIDRIAGHVPGALNRPYLQNLRDGRFKPAAELAAEFDALLAGRGPGRAIAMCGSGVTACHHLLALAHAGRDGAALYTGSWSGWIEDASRPVARDAG